MLQYCDNLLGQYHRHHHHHHHISVMEMGHLLTRFGLTYPEVSSKVYHDSFCQLGSSISLSWDRNPVITPMFKKGDRREPQNYRGISILKSCYELYSEILNMKLQKYLEVFMTETQDGFRKGRSCTDPTFCL